jgi:glutamate racemase
VVQLLGGPVPGHEGEGDEALALFTDGKGVTRELRRAMSERGLTSVDIEAMPLRG